VTPAPRLQRPSRAIGILSLILGTAGLLWGQAWLPARGEGSIYLSYLSLLTSDHLLGSGQPLDRGPTRLNTVTAGLTYGISDRLAVSAEIPYIASKFDLKPGLAPNAHDLEATIDDGRYHGTFQDFRAEVKYNAVKGPLMFTPFFGLVIPSHSYVTFGHSAPGKDLREYHVGANVGRLLNPLLPRAYFDLRYGYSFVQNLDGMNLDRNNVDLEVGYFLKPSLAVRGIGSVQKTLGGVESLVSPDSPFFPDHDRLERGHYSRIGGGVTFSLRPNVDLYFLVVSTLSGKNVQSFTAPGIGISWNFQRSKPHNQISRRAAVTEQLMAGKMGRASR
jgi:hypothetical protein